MPRDDRRLVVDCSGVGPGGITRVLTEIVRHWPADRLVELVAVPAEWELPAGTSAAVAIRSRQARGRERTIAAAAAALRRATAGVDTRVLSVSPSLAVLGSRAPVTTIVHDFAFRLWPNGLSRAQLRYRRASYAAALRRSERLLCVSARTRHDLLGLYGIADRARVWHPGSDLVEPGKLPEALAEVPGDYLVIPGHAAHKGVELAVEALAELSRYVLVVLTGGAVVESFRRAARSGAADRIVFLDRLSDAEYAATIAGAAAFLMPSHFEGYGLPAAEAVRLGTPTVISPDPALHEATGGAAIRMDSWTAASLTRALREIDRSARPIGTGLSAYPTGTRRLARPTGTGRSWAAAVEDLARELAR
jgi:glycosyltransferase involved in cell wall biosynthesis